MDFVETARNVGFWCGTVGFWSIVGAVSGVVYGALFNADKKTAAVAFAIFNVVWHLHHNITEMAAGGWEAKPIATCASLVTGTLVIGTIQIVAFRHLGLFGTPGTVYLSSVLALVSVAYLSAAYFQTYKVPAAP